MTRTLLVLLTGLAVLGAALPAAPQTSVDPQSLVGDWTGTSHQLKIELTKAK